MKSVGTRSLLLALGCALAVAGCDSGAEDDPWPDLPESGDEGVEDTVYELTGSWESGFVIRFEGDVARLLEFGTASVTGRQHFDVGDEYIRDIERVDASTWKAEMVRFERVAAPGELSSLHIVGVSYVPTMLRRSGSFLILEIDNGLGTRLTSSSKTELAYGGACENKFVNIQGHTLYLCNDDVDEDSCLSPGELKFWPNTTCRQLGYSYEEESAQFQHDEGNNGLPGDRGQWGDKSGGTGAGFADGSGGKPPADAVPVVEGMGMMMGSAGSGGGAAGTSGGASGKDCLVGGKWHTNVCSAGSGKTATLSFTNGGTGEFTNPDCNGFCTTDIVFGYTYTVSGSSVTLHYVSSKPITCDGNVSTPAKPTTDDTFSFTCSGGSLTTMTSRGSASYMRRP